MVGAGGVLGAAVLERSLGCGAFRSVGVAAVQPLAGTTTRGLVPLRWADAPALRDFGAETGFIVLDRERHANGRELAWFRPEPDRLAAVAGALCDAGVRRLVVVLPHDAAQWPEALRHGLANLDEHAVAALGFSHLVLMRTAKAPAAAAAASPLQRLAHGVLAQLRLMVPQQHRPVRAAQVAAFAVELAQALPQVRAGTRVAPAELVWLAAQKVDAGALARRWLADGAVPSASVVPPRL